MVMQIELACRFYASGWLTIGLGARMANLDHYAFGVALAERGIPRQYGIAESQEDLSGEISPEVERAHLAEVRECRAAVYSGTARLIDGTEALRKARAGVRP